MPVRLQTIRLASVLIAWLGAHTWAVVARAAEAPPTVAPSATATPVPPPATVAPPQSPTAPVPSPTIAATVPASSSPGPALSTTSSETGSPTASESETPDVRFVPPQPPAHETWEAPDVQRNEAGEKGASGKGTRTPIPPEELIRQAKPGGVLLSTALAGTSLGDGGPTADVVFMWYIGRILYFESPDPFTPVDRRVLHWLDPLGAMLLGPDLKYSLTGSDPEQPALALGAFAPFILQIDPKTRSVAAPLPNQQKNFPIPLLCGYAATTQHIGSLDLTFGAFGGTFTRLFSYLTTNLFYSGLEPWEGSSIAFAYSRGSPLALGVYGGLNTQFGPKAVNLKLEVIAPVPHPQSPVLIHVRVTRFLPFDFAFLFYNWRKGYWPDSAILGMYDYRVTLFPKK